MESLLWLLLPVAALSGWFAAKRHFSRPTPGTERSALRSDYFRGIDHLLNEQPDKAIEAFIRVLEVDAETVETHLSLGNLYRRRGEVDRAIRVHQNLISTATGDELRAEAMLELGHDYLSAGLLDRAEDLFLELVEADRFREQALRQLIDIYEQEKDWSKAINAARQLESMTGNPLSAVIANYWCERAERAQVDSEPERALEHAQAALGTHAGCARASILVGDVLAARGDAAGAMAAWRTIESQDADLLAEVMDRLRDAAQTLDRTDELASFLRTQADAGSISATLALADMLERETGGEEARDFMAARLARRPSLRGFRRLMELEYAHGELSQRPHAAILRDLAGQILADRPVYKCDNCGFPARSLHWQCPGCKQWNTVKPIQEAEGE